MKCIGVDKIITTKIGADEVIGVYSSFMLV